MYLKGSHSICRKCFSLQINIFSFALSAYADGADLRPRWGQVGVQLGKAIFKFWRTQVQLTREI